MNLFDLNIEKILDNWSNADAVREIIANALDERELTKTDEIIIKKDDCGRWHIRDFGRGIEPKHFTQNENLEKRNAKNLIGKFGVGLKDALGVFFNNGIKVVIDSKYGHITFEMAKKEGFCIELFHAIFSDSLDRNMQGTDFSFCGLQDEDINEAKQMFLVFNHEELLETTEFGQICLRLNNHPAYIYINGVRVAEEDDFLFSYNIAELNYKIRKALNRERSNVGRSAYTDSVKKILLHSTSDRVLKPLVDDINNVVRGTARDESKWVDVASYAVKILNKNSNFVFMTPYERSELTNEEVEILNENGKKLILIPNSVIGRVGHDVTTFKDVLEEYNETFKYSFVDENDLSFDEKRVFSLTQDIKSLLRKNKCKVDIPILISETIKIDSFGKSTNGVYEQKEERIIIKRSILKNQKEFCGVLTHELCHYQHGHDDNTRDFENDLTDLLGIVINTVLSKNMNDK